MIVLFGKFALYIAIENLESHIYRRLIYGSFLLSTPRLMEPIVFSEIHCSADVVSSIYTILTRRRGHVLKDVPKPGTPFYIVHAYLPAVESFGFETDLRYGYITMNKLNYF